MACRKLLSRRPKPGEVDQDRYRYLHRDGRRLITGWYRRAVSRSIKHPIGEFESFIFGWIALNAWAACVTEKDSDREWRDTLILDAGLAAEFERLRECNQKFEADLSGFCETWPIFEVQQLRAKGLLYGAPRDSERKQLVNWYLENGAEKFSPSCFSDHQDNNECVPHDWPHTLDTLYRVRCNLFHGEKAGHSEMDRHIVSAARSVLLGFLEGSGVLEQDVLR